MIHRTERNMKQKMAEGVNQTDSGLTKAGVGADQKQGELNYKPEIQAH